MDATQEAFLRGYRALGQSAAVLQGPGFCASHHCSTTVAGARGGPTSSFDDLVEVDEHSTLLEDDQERPEAFVERQELGTVLQGALDILPDEQRVIVILSDVQGLSYEEIATTLDLALGTVKSRLSRGRAKLRDYLVTHQELLPEGFRLGL
jgi:RNA polymerase sigma-70 factor (ECF subfamily)